MEVKDLTFEQLIGKLSEIERTKFRVRETSSGHELIFESTDRESYTFSNIEMLCEWAKAHDTSVSLIGGENSLRVQLFSLYGTEKPKTYFVKEYSDGSYSVGYLSGEPNEFGEIDFTGYSVSPTYMEAINSDFLSEGEVEKITKENSIASAITFEKIEQLYSDLKQVTQTDKDNIEIEELEETEEEEVLQKAIDIISEAYSIIDKSVRI